MTPVDAETVLETRRSYIGGRYVDSTTGETFETRHPGTDRVVCDVEQAGEREVELAVESAEAGFAEWSAMPAVERSRALLRAVSIIRDRTDELAALDTLDAGRPIAETTTEDVVTGADVIEFYAGLAPAIHGDTIDFPTGFSRTRREPLGVCAGIGAWNYPIQIAMWKSGLALACGNAMIFKPAEITPISASFLAEIYVEAGVPEAVAAELERRGHRVHRGVASCVSPRGMFL